ncbi:MAG: glycosyltransferase family 2 protein [Halanaerobiaceae bacterium]|jgi:glycosyltransferase involved in cell wall biosynthesis|nr:glycosyltransferase family 2 protein [Halanaerobiaceae bacterium]
MEKIYRTQKKDLVSIIIPGYNYGCFITDALDGLRKQSYRKMEIIVLDDCSTDNTREIVEKWQEKYGDIFEDFVYLLLPERIPTPWVINIGFLIAAGEYIVIHDADDISREDKIEKQLKWLEAHPETAVVGTKYQDFVGTKEGAVGYSLWVLTDRQEIIRRYLETPYHCVCFGTIMFRKEILNTILACKRLIGGFGDYEFIKRIILSNYIIDNIDEYLFYVRNHSGQSTRNKDIFLYKNETGKKASLIVPVMEVIETQEDLFSLILQDDSIDEVIIIADESMKNADYYPAFLQYMNNKEMNCNSVSLKIPVKIDYPGLYLIALHFTKNKRVFFYSNDSGDDKLIEMSRKFTENAGLDRLISIYRGG